MSQIFFDELDLPNPYKIINIKKSQGVSKIGNTILVLQQLISKLAFKIDLGIVVGDVDATLAAALVLKRNEIKIAHVESGLRSYNSSMPEEINRKCTDHISDILFTTSIHASRNLINEKINKNNVFFIGNTMIDTLIKYKKKIKNNNFYKKYNLKKKEYIVMTIHRQENTLDYNKINLFIENLTKKFNKKYKIVFVTHPRLKRIRKNKKLKNVLFLDPLGYVDFLNLVKYSKFAVTDSGGLSEETSILNIRCFTLRNETERPETVTFGSNVLVGFNSNSIKKIGQNSERKCWPKKIKFWDGKSSDRIYKIINRIL